jgi:hypothetical protein
MQQPHTEPEDVIFHNTGHGFTEIIDLQNQPDPRTLFVEEESEEGW